MTSTGSRPMVSVTVSPDYLFAPGRKRWTMFSLNFANLGVVPLLANGFHDVSDIIGGYAAWTEVVQST